MTLGKYFGVHYIWPKFKEEHNAQTFSYDFSVADSIRF